MIDPATTAALVAPSASAAIKAWLERNRRQLDELAKIDPGDIQAVAASQLGLLASFYEIALFQARRSFRWALIGAALGIAFFMVAIIVLLASGDRDAATISAISGGIVELLSAINFALYGRATVQLVRFHDRLEQTQRYLLANSLCESVVGDDHRNMVRAKLIETIAAGRPVISEQ